MANRRPGPVKITRADGTVEVSHSVVATALKLEVFARDGLCCRHCGFRHKSATMYDVDHVVPVSRGGTNTLKNLVVACKRCNSLKGQSTWTPMLLRDARKMDFPFSQFMVLRSQGMTADEARSRLARRRARRGR